jgi:NADH-quinone oxidoreductase subunit L
MEYTILNVAPIVLLPFLAFVINTFIVKRFTTAAVFISCAAIFGSFIQSFRIFKDFVWGTYSSDFYIHKFFTWIDLTAAGQAFKIDMGIYIDNMTAIMLLMVSGIAFLIHIFSTYYMHDDARYGRFFVYLSLFTSAMLGLVLSDNLLSVFIFWEIMGFCSYSLVGFYYEKEGAGNASLKAFMTTRVGDMFFLLAIVAIWTTVGSVNFVDIYAAISRGTFEGVMAVGMPVITLAAIGIFLGTIGKSAQFPLQVWLPDAMFGPTPCSALIHAATMVAAGVYLSLRAFPILEAGGILPVVAYIGAITAFGAATIALIQTDIKAVLAYSTISQLGYMVLGIGAGAYNAAFMHIITHAVFKACLFLSAGSVIHSLHDHHTHEHVQEMPRMGGLRKKLPFTFLAMLCCTLAIAGIPLFSGFISKDRILGDALVLAMENKVYIIPTILGFAGALLTAFYMFRMMFLTFFGEPRDKELYDHAHKEHFKWNQNLPLLILTVFTLGGWYAGSFTGLGFDKIPGVKNQEWFQTLVQKPQVEKFTTYTKEPFGSTDTRTQREWVKSEFDKNQGLSEDRAHHVHHVHHIGAIASIVIAVLGVFFAYLMYIARVINPAKFVSAFGIWYRALQNKYYFDDLYLKGLINRVALPLNRFTAGFDRVAVDAFAVDGTGAIVRFFNMVLRTLQSGRIQFYFVVTIVVLAGYIWSLRLA